MRYFKSFCRIIVCISLAVTFDEPTATGQQPRVYRERVKPNWFADGKYFWYRVRLPNGQSEFVLVNPGQGTRKPAFDHQRLAKALADVTGRNVEANRLPADAIEFNDHLTSVTLRGGIGAWKVQLDSYEIESLDHGGSRVGTTAFFLPPRKSVDRGGDVQLQVTNTLDSNVELVWIDRDGSQKVYGNIRSGEKRGQHTFAGHVWLLRSNGRSLACFEAFDGSNEIVISPETLENVRARSAKPKVTGRDRRRRRAAPGTRSPDGQYDAFVENHNLWLNPLNTEGKDAQPIQLSTDGTLENSFHKDAQRARLVEMDYLRSDFDDSVSDVRWSPDGKHLLAFQTTHVPERRVEYIESSPKDGVHPRARSYPYAKPGDPIPVRTPRLFAITDLRDVTISNELFPNPFKLQFLRWADDGTRFWMFYNQRGHQNLKVLEVDVGDGSVRVIVDESSDTFIHYSTAGKFVLDWLGEEQLLWASERSGWNHVYRYDVATGAVLNPVTSGEWNVRRIEHIDRDAGVIWFYAVGIVKDQDPYHEHFCRVNLDGSELKVLTSGDGHHEIEFSPDRDVFLDRYSRVDLAPITELRRSSDGGLVVRLENGDASEIVRTRGPLPERFVAKGRDGKTDIYGIIHLPRNFDPTFSYPVVENIYAGPHDHHVPKAFRSTYRHQQQIADRGVIVVQIDGMGTAWRSKEFHDVCHKNLRDAGFPDRIAWIRAAAKQRPYMDVNRVGIYGGSAGGQNAMAALLWHGAFYKVAVADCGCHDNRMDKLWWNEQWMGWPVDDFYASNSNTENAYRLQGKLMLVVGELDRNVDPASTTQVVNALIQADKDFQFLLVPGAGHGACERPYGARRRADFLAENLRAIAP